MRDFTAHHCERAPRRWVEVSVFFRDYQQTHGRCPACGAVMDQSGCRVISVGLCAPQEEHLRELAPEYHELRQLLFDHPYSMSVECCDPARLAEVRAWVAAGGRRRPDASPV